MPVDVPRSHGYECHIYERFAINVNVNLVPPFALFRCGVGVIRGLIPIFTVLFQETQLCADCLVIHVLCTAVLPRKA